jgi:signal peptide peptidase SppA
MNNDISRKYPHLSARLFNTPLLISPSKLDAILYGLSGRLCIDVPKPEAYLLNSPKRKPNEYVVDRGVAIIDVFGVLVHRGEVINADSSAIQSYSGIATQLTKAAQDGTVKKIVLNIDSPGGEVSGLMQLADQIYQLRQSKPIEAFVNDLSASAAYWLASAASSITLTESSQVGSIGVVMRHMDVSHALSQDGLKITHIYAGKHKVDGNPYEPLTESVKNDFQKDVDYYYDLFVNAVAKHRKIDVQVVRDTEAKVFCAHEAIALGLADRIASSPFFVQSLMEVPVDLVEMQEKVNSVSALNADLQLKLSAAQDDHVRVVTDLSAKLQAEAEQSKALLDRANALEAELNQFKADVRLNAVKALFSDLHRDVTDAAIQPYLEMNDVTFAAVANDLRSLKAPALSPSLFKETAVNGVVPNKNETELAAQLFAQVAGVKV